jgi:hypothetical protein
MWHGNSKNWYPNEGLTVREFICRLMYTNERPKNIPEIRWNAMLNWFKIRLNEGLDMEEISELG